MKKDRIRDIKKWFESQFLMAFLRLMWLVPYESRNNLMGWLMRTIMGRITGYRKRTKINLDLIYPNIADTVKQKISDNTLDNAGRTFLENMYPAQFQAKTKNINLWGEGLDELEHAHALGRPIMFYSGHFGNHEAFRLALYKRGIKVGGLIRPMSNTYFDYHYQKTLLIEGKSGPVFEPGVQGTLGFYKSIIRAF